jgi:putative endonuclease
VKVFDDYPYHVYIVTNANRSVLYTGVTNDLQQRLTEHFSNRGNPKTFAGKFFTYNLIFFEGFEFIVDAIAREKEIKGWIREKKIALIHSKNPSWKFLNKEVCGSWPPCNKGI